MHCALIHIKAPGPRVLSAEPPTHPNHHRESASPQSSLNIFSFQTKIIYLERAKVKCHPPASLKAFICVARTILSSPVTTDTCRRMLLSSPSRPLNEFT